MRVLPTFYPTLAHTDNIAYYDQNGVRSRMSSTRIWPAEIRENVLMNLSFDPEIHYSTDESSGDPDGLDILRTGDRWIRSQNIFVDCGAIQYIDEKYPSIDGVVLTADLTWRRYQETHFGKENRWKNALVCSPDHIVLPTHSRKEALRRLKITRDFAEAFIEVVDMERVTPVAVIHGQNAGQRKWQLDYFIRLGYTHFAFGGAVPLATDKPRLLEFLAGITDVENPVIGRNSVLGKIRRLGMKIHIFGLNSPDWYRWWRRLGVDSFDGSKITTEGAAMGWYWEILEDIEERIARGDIPPNVLGLYRKTKVGEYELNNNRKNWKSTNGESGRVMLKPIGRDLPSCECLACRYMMNVRCTSERCTTGLKAPHSGDPRTMGSTEHNHGRVAHNAYIYMRLMNLVNSLVKRASVESTEEWATNWLEIRIA